MFRKTKKRTFEEEIVAAIRADLSKYPKALERDLTEYRERLRRKRETAAALEKAEAEVERLRSEGIELKKKFWADHYEPDETALAKFERRYRPLERATRKAEKTLRRARVNFEKADFDEVAESFALKAKADIAQDEVNRRIVTLEKALEDLFAGVRQEVEKNSQALRDEYEEPRFDTTEERDAHVERTIGILNAVAESYAPGK